MRPRIVLLLSLFVVLHVAAPRVHAQPAPTPTASTTPQPPLTGFVRNWTRVESWSFFEPPPGGGDPTSSFIGNRLLVGLRRTTPRWELTAALQYVQLGGLPERSVGPGVLGLGAVYFDHAGRSNPGQIYLRYLNLRLKNLAGGLSVQAGRMGYTSGAEAASGVPKLEAVKRQRVDSRLIGEFEFSLFQRGYDGVRGDWARKTWQLSMSALQPTQGGFEDAAGPSIDRIKVYTAALTLKPGAVLPRTDWQIFAHRYDDTRPVRARPDNTGRPASAVSVHITSVGTTLVRAFPSPHGEFDALAWVVGQTGWWYGEPHRGWALAAELGHQWLKAPWRPWIRAGYLRASGDPDPGDGRHSTFFQMLPTVRKYSLSASYSQMNLTDAFAQVLVRPSQRLSGRFDLHRVGLADAADRWYAGSGAGQASGTIFGYAGRPSRGATDLGTVAEGSIDYTASRHLSLNAYLGVIKGGEIVRRTFQGHWLRFGFIETVIQF